MPKSVDLDNINLAIRWRSETEERKGREEGVGKALDIRYPLELVIE